MNRRRFVGWVGGAILTGAGAVMLGRQRIKDLLLSTSFGQHARERILGVDSSREPSALTAEDESALRALAATVLPSDPGADAEDAVMTHLRWLATEEAGYADEFRRARVLLDEEAQRKVRHDATFARLAPPESQAVIRALLEGVIAHQLTAAPRGTVLRLAIDRRFLRSYRLRRHVVNEILVAYYTSRPGWAKFHYRSFPGGCAGLAVYSQAP